MRTTSLRNPSLSSECSPKRLRPMVNLDLSPMTRTEMTIKKISNQQEIDRQSIYPLIGMIKRKINMYIYIYIHQIYWTAHTYIKPFFACLVGNMMLETSQPPLVERPICLCFERLHSLAKATILVKHTWTGDNCSKRLVDLILDVCNENCEKWLHAIWH